MTDQATLMIRAVAPADEARAIDTVVLAFAADPVARWNWPESHQYLTHGTIQVGTSPPLVPMLRAPR